MARIMADASAAPRQVSFACEACRFCPPKLWTTLWVNGGATAKTRTAACAAFDCQIFRQEIFHANQWLARM
jgi:hypothetical protein